MIHIERLSLKLFINPIEEKWVAPANVARGQTFVEYLYDHRTKSAGRPLWYYRRKYLAKDINRVLPNKIPNIKIAKYFGIDGIDLDQLLLSPLTNIENLVLEVPVEYLPAISKKRLKELFENHVIMLNDFEEFCTTYGVQRPHIVTILKENNIKPKCLFLVGAPFQMHSEYPELNIYTVPFDYWLLVSITVQDFFLNAVTDTIYKNKLMTDLQQSSVNDCVIPIFKPRIHRIKLLSYLDKIGVLERCDWSLPFNQSKRFNSYMFDPIGAPTDTSPDEILTEDDKNFLNKYSFPKELNFDEKWKLKDSPYSHTPTLTSPEWFNQYKFNLASETYIGDEIEPIMGGCASITEKTFKALIYGSVPIIHGGKGSTEQLANLGFKTQFGNYDSSDVVEIGKIMLEIQKDPYVNKDMVLHNFDRITDLEFLTSVISTPLNKIADLINSIRR